MSREDSPGWQKPHSQPFAGLGEDFEPSEVKLEEPLQTGNGRIGPFSGSLSDMRLYSQALGNAEVKSIAEQARMYVCVGILVTPPFPALSLLGSLIQDFTSRH